MTDAGKDGGEIADGDGSPDAGGDQIADVGVDGGAADGCTPDCAGKCGGPDECGGTCPVNNQYSIQCYNNDVYWYDCHGLRQAKKEECEANGCSGGACQSSSDFTCASGICTDPTTGFEWQQEPTGLDMEWSDAITHCQNLNLSGTGWRLPNISELRSLVRNCGPIETGGACGVKDECSPCGVSSGAVCLENSCRIDSACNPTSCTNDGGPTGCYWPEELNGICSHYWSSSSNADDSSTAWHVYFHDGRVDSNDKTSSNNVRCVRGGP